MELAGRSGTISSACKAIPETSNIMRGDVDTGEHTFRHYCRIYAVLCPPPWMGNRLTRQSNPMGL